MLTLSNMTQPVFKTGRNGAHILRKTRNRFDAFDVAILSALSTNPRATTVELAAKVHLSRTAIARRIANLRKQGALLEPVEIASYRWLGFDIHATVDIEATAKTVPKLILRLLRLPEVLSVSTNDHHLLLRVIATDREHFRRFIRGIRTYGSLTVRLVDSTKPSPFTLAERFELLTQRNRGNAARYPRPDKP